MITLKKLACLKDSTRYRKIYRLLRQIRDDESRDLQYLSGLVELLRPIGLQTANSFDTLIENSDNQTVVRSIEHLRAELQNYLGESEADWDFEKDQRLGADTKNGLFPEMHVYAEDIRSPFNLGSIIRSAEALGFTSVIRSPFSTDFNHARCLRTAMGAERNISLSSMNLEELSAYAKEKSMKLFSLELGGEQVQNFIFPEKGIVIIGSEELGVSAEALALCRDPEIGGGIVSIPLFGKKGSLNVGVAFGILAQNWTV